MRMAAPAPRLVAPESPPLTPVGSPDAFHPSYVPRPPPTRRSQFRVRAPAPPPPSRPQRSPAFVDGGREREVEAERERERERPLFEFDEDMEGARGGTPALAREREREGAEDEQGGPPGSAPVPIPAGNSAASDGGRSAGRAFVGPSTAPPRL